MSSTPQGQVNYSTLVTTIAGAALIGCVGLLLVVKDSVTESRVEIRGLSLQVATLQASNQDRDKRILDLERRK